MRDFTVAAEAFERAGIEALHGVPLCDYTSFKIGGKAALFVTPASAAQAGEAVKICRATGVPYFVLGRGSNLLVADTGYDGVIIQIGSGLSAVKVSGRTVTAGGGASLASICRAALEAGLTGLEFAFGIPGGVGGGVAMNAGAYGGELKDVITGVEYIDENGDFHSVTASELDFGYRHSFFSSKKCIITRAVFELERGDRALVKEKMDDILARRADKQPLNYPSAGSVFLRPEGHFAGALIEGAGLKGTQIGGAMVSKKHAGFIVNVGGATASDVASLIELIKDKVYQSSGVTLVCEIKRLGFSAE